MHTTNMQHKWQLLLKQLHIYVDLCASNGAYNVIMTFI